VLKIFRRSSKKSMLPACHAYRLHFHQPSVKTLVAGTQVLEANRLISTSAEKRRQTRHAFISRFATANCSALKAGLARDFAHRWTAPQRQRLRIVDYDLRPQLLPLTLPAKP